MSNRLDDKATKGTGFVCGWQEYGTMAAGEIHK
jgi:hypothetical protein